MEKIRTVKDTNLITYVINLAKKMYTLSYPMAYMYCLLSLRGKLKTSLKVASHGFVQLQPDL